jgi:hypothetical protein
MTAKAAFALAAMLACAACGPTRWDRPDTTAQAAEADLADCRRSAQQETQRDAARYAIGPGYPLWRGSPYDDVRWRAEYDQWSFNQRIYLRNRLVAYCMHTKGYERVPVQP